MRNAKAPQTLVFLLAGLLLASGALQAQEHTRIFCSQCRDPNVHPSDFGNSAVNTARTPNSGLTFEDLDVVEVINPAGQWAWVNMDFEMLTLDLGFEIPTFVFPTGNIVIEVTDANARLTSYLVDLRIPNQLAVGTGTGPGYNPEGGSDSSDSDDSSSSGGSGGGDYDSYDDYGDYWDGWENGYGGQMAWDCAGDYSDPSNTKIVCSAP
jgi:hypothetical protein